jgi:hypothetical protein
VHENRGSSVAKVVAHIVLDTEYWDELAPVADGLAATVFVLPRESVVAHPFTAGELAALLELDSGEIDY